MKETFKDYYKLPFELKKGLEEIYVFAQDNPRTGLTKSFDWLVSDKKFGLKEKQEIINKLNGKESKTSFLGDFIQDGDRIIYIGEKYKNPKPILKVRGWGMLVKAYKLDPDTALKIQNELLGYCVTELNKKNEV